MDKVAAEVLAPVPGTIRLLVDEDEVWRRAPMARIEEADSRLHALVDLPLGDAGTSASLSMTVQTGVPVDGQTWVRPGLG